MTKVSKKEEFAMDPYIGKLLDNRYEILELRGVGGMARVYKARCHRLNRMVAIKILREDLAQDTETRRRFHDESQAVAMLSHPNIVAVYDVSRSSELEYIVMELIDGITLKQYMQKKGNKLNWREALHFITQIVKALGHAHSRGIIHRDIKPHNIMVLRDGSVKVADFGIARVASCGHSTLTQEALGSVHYISPEQARGSHIDARSDLYSAGVVLYEMTTGRLPFEGDSPVAVAIQHINSIPLSPRELDNTIPEALETITMRAMAPNVSNRYSSAAEMLADLEEFRKNPNINFDYSMTEFAEQEASVDQSDKTQIRGVIPIKASPSSAAEHRKQEPEHEEDTEKENQRNIWPVVGAVLMVLFFVGFIVFFVFKSFVSDLMAPVKQYNIPDLTGKLYETVLEDKELLGEFVLVEGEFKDDDAPAGTILKQTPVAGTQVLDATAEITLTISKGPKVVEMISVYNVEYLKALVELQNMGLKVKEPTYEYSDDVQSGHIISASPQAGTPMNPEVDEVQLVVSLGKRTRTVTLINCIGETRGWAESKLALLNLEVKVVESYSSEIPAGQVIDQNPKANTKVEEGSTVNLEVSIGPDPSDLPKPVTKEIMINLPENTEDGEFIQMTVTMNGETVFDQSVDTSMEMAVPVTVTGTGESILSVYFNGVLNHTVNVNFSE